MTDHKNASLHVARFRMARRLSACCALVGIAIQGGAAFSTGGHQVSAEKPGAAGAIESAHVSSANYARYADVLRRWDKQTVTVFVDAATEQGKTPQQTMNLVAQGMSLWNTRLGSSIRLEQTADAERADVDLSFVNAGTLAGGAIGRTDVTFRLDDQVLTHASVHIDRRLPSAELVQVAAHELGHALGIQGHSPDKRDLMYAYAHLPAEITDRDINTMAVSYGSVNIAAGAPANSATESDTAAELSPAR